MKQVGIVGGLRSYIGVENGMYRNVSAEQLGAHVLREVIGRYAIPMEDIDGIIAGNGVGAGGNLTRLMMLEAGIRNGIPAMTVDVQCGSGLEAIATAAAKIESGLAEVILAGGFESCSTKPLRIRNERHPDYVRTETEDAGLVQPMTGDPNAYQTAKFAPGRPDELAMLRGAERVAEAWNMDKRKLDRYAMDSHKKAVMAAESGELQGILAAPFSTFTGKGGEAGSSQGADQSGHFPHAVESETNGSMQRRSVQPQRIRDDRDEGIRKRISEALLDRLPLLVSGGMYITAGNACLTHDGAAFVALCSKEYLSGHNRKQKAEIVDVVAVGGDPQRSPESILPAIDRVLQRNHLSPEQITAWEFNEAFAVMDALMESRYGRNPRYNIFGGALAYGHPYGASGGILILHLMQALNRLERPEGMREKYGIAAIAAAGGIGTAMLIRSSI